MDHVEQAVPTLDRARRRKAITAGAWALVAAALVSVSGCPSAPSSPAPGTSSRPAFAPPVRVIVLDDPKLAKVIQREWTARSEVKIEVAQKTSQELTGDGPLAADVLIYPSAMLGPLAQRQRIVPLPEHAHSSQELARDDIFPLLRLREITWGSKVYAVPLGSPQLTLLYRADLLKHLDKEPPKTWAEYQELAELLSRRELMGDLAPAGDAPWHGVVEPLAEGWAGQVLLARAATYARHRSNYSVAFDYRTMQPLINGPPFVRALQELVAAAGQGPAEAISFTPTDARQLLLAGRCGMALSWPTAAPAAKDDMEAMDNVAVGFAELPGSPEVYNVLTDRWETRPASASERVPLLAVAGRLGSVTAEARNARAAAAVLTRLSSADWSGDVAPHSAHTTLFRFSQVKAARKWLPAGTGATPARQYAEVVQQTQSRGTAMFALRIPGRRQYLAALDKAVHEALAGDKTPQDALNTAAEIWQVVTDQLGRDAQHAAYSRSLGREP